MCKVFCGLLDRVIQFADIMADSHQHVNACPYQAILGDLNTMAHSIARLSPKYCTDRMRFGSLGKAEAEWWVDNLLSFDVDVRDIQKIVKLHIHMQPHSADIDETMHVVCIKVSLVSRIIQ